MTKAAVSLLLFPIVTHASLGSRVDSAPLAGVSAAISCASHDAAVELKVIPRPDNRSAQISLRDGNGTRSYVSTMKREFVSCCPRSHPDACGCVGEIEMISLTLGRDGRAELSFSTESRHGYGKFFTALDGTIDLSCEH